MKDYLIYTDVSTDIDPAVVKEKDIHFIPMNYTIGSEDRLCEGLEDDELLKKFYQGQRDGDLTHTSQITPQKYIDAFTPALAEGKDILYICLSSGLTKTYDSARLAKMELEETFPNAKVYPVDSLGATAGMGLLTEFATEYRDAGMTIEENVKALEDIRLNVNHLFMVEDLMYLKRGGRVSAATAVVGTMLNIKPILIIDENGKLVTIDKKRGVKPAIKDMIGMVKNTRDPQYHRYYFLHSDAPERADMLIEQIKEMDPEAVCKMRQLCPVIGAHTGPGMAAVVWVGDRKKLQEQNKKSN